MEQNNLGSEQPQILEEHGSKTSANKKFPVLVILGTLVVFIMTGVVLLYNSKKSSNASYRPQMNYTTEDGLQPRATIAILSPSATPTAASSEENTVQNIKIDDGASDFSSIDQASSGL